MIEPYSALPFEKLDEQGELYLIGADEDTNVAWFIYDKYDLGIGKEEALQDLEYVRLACNKFQEAIELLINCREALSWEDNYHPKIEDLDKFLKEVEDYDSTGMG